MGFNSGFKGLKLHPVAGRVKILSMYFFGLLFLLIVWTDLSRTLPHCLSTV